MKEILVGERAEVYTRVTTDKLAIAVGSGSLKVFATPSMAALMEEASCAAVKPFLDENETTVGTSLHIEHTSSTPMGMTVFAEAEIIAVSGREITFQVSARDEIGNIGHGTHKRVVVKSDKFQAKTDTKGIAG
ncbi:MAG: dihydrolipoamide acyltransferase [Oscillospiraceae bacterium]|nr:dihydrolipoamide acyltransferase [Oscillospiraceae bacterium]